MCIDQFSLEAIFEQGSAASIGVVECARVAAKDPLGQQAGRGYPILADKPMIMVGQQTVGNDSNLAHFARLFHQVKDTLVVLVAPKDRLPARAPVVQMI